VIINDRANVSPEIMDSMRAEIVQVISKYMYIDTREMEFALENENDAMALVVNIPVVSVQHGGAHRHRR
jgi:cell division topological specificity factor minE